MDGRLRLGWHYQQKWGSPRYCNSCFEADKGAEDEAICRDEARLLYVALTRAKRNLIVVLTNNGKGNTWSNFLASLRESR